MPKDLIKQRDNTSGNIGTAEEMDLYLEKKNEV